ncbi:hypothetical protein BJ508DRAFT_350489 [Ascobolus immersus RN42]|uniref:YDG domain-containing protein n=1 Tax=Ascobolus immersus RN42 TaxID=1160509 RepID=A0A3N4HWF4_ASCIM|nr:hypothetical protein BJ508DRAFT_350489 [Ascobolus immersus RN42]
MARQSPQQPQTLSTMAQQQSLQSCDYQPSGNSDGIILTEELQNVVSRREYEFIEVRTERMITIGTPNSSLITYHIKFIMGQSFLSGLQGGNGLLPFAKELDGLAHSYSDPTITLPMVHHLDLPSEVERILRAFPEHLNPTSRAQYTLEIRILQARWERGIVFTSPDLQYLKRRTAPLGRVGHAGFLPGQVFRNPSQMHYVGLHQQPGHGIHANQQKGVLSIALSDRSSWVYHDADRGTEMDYCGTRNALAGLDPTSVAPDTRVTRHMEEAIASGQAVRVIRGPDLHNVYAPRYGYRYDGLYRVVSFTEAHNHKRFRLIRLADSQNEGIPFEAIQGRPTSEAVIEKLRSSVPDRCEWSRTRPRR